MGGGISNAIIHKQHSEKFCHKRISQVQPTNFSDVKHTKEKEKPYKI
jgi:hypothetical protein